MRFIALIITVITVINPIFISNVFGEISAEDFIIRGGFSQPIGETSDTWLAGYSAGLDYICQTNNTYNWGIRANINRWQVDAEGMLQANSDDLFIERNHGWNSIGDLSGLLLFSPEKFDWLTLEGGAGLYHVRWSEVSVKGFVPIFDPNDPGNNSAINYEAYKDEGSELTAGVSLALSIRLLNSIEPTVRYQYVFSSDDPVSFVVFGIGFLAH